MQHRRLFGKVASPWPVFFARKSYMNALCSYELRSLWCRAATVNFKETMMKNILFVSSSPRGRESYSNRVARRIVDDLIVRHPDARVIVRDVARQPLPHIGAAFATGRVLPGEKRSALEQQALALSETLVDELLAADIVVVAVPMHNFGIPSSLKAWIDHIVRPGRTFSYSEKGAQGLVTGKKVVLVFARGGVYSDGPMQGFDFQEPYVRAVLGMIGATDVDVVRVEGVALGNETARQALRSAEAQADAIVRRITAPVADDVRVVA
jgi:FMN-dependent NADH-azoreductase